MQSVPIHLALIVAHASLGLLTPLEMVPPVKVSETPTNDIRQHLDSVFIESLHGMSSCQSESIYFFYLDTDECSDPALNNCHQNAVCTNTPGSHTCTCKPGFTDTSGDGTTCDGKRNSYELYSSTFGFCFYRNLTLNVVVSDVINHISFT